MSGLQGHPLSQAHTFEPTYLHTPTNQSYPTRLTMSTSHSMAAESVAQSSGNSQGSITTATETFTLFDDLPVETRMRIIEFTLSASRDESGCLDDSDPRGSDEFRNHRPKSTTIRDILSASKFFCHFGQSALSKKVLFMIPDPELISEKLHTPVMVIHKDLTHTQLPFSHLVKHVHLFGSAEDIYKDYVDDKSGAMDANMTQRIVERLARDQMDCLDILVNLNLQLHLDTLTLELSPYHTPILITLLLRLNNHGFLQTHRQGQTRKELHWTRVPLIKRNPLQNNKENIETVAWTLQLSEPPVLHRNRTFRVEKLVLEVNGEEPKKEGVGKCQHVQGFLHSDYRWMIAAACEEAFALKAVFGGLEGWPMMRKEAGREGCKWGDPDEDERERLLAFGQLATEDED